jgi:hypothetical protein
MTEWQDRAAAMKAEAAKQMADAEKEFQEQE